MDPRHANSVLFKANLVPCKDRRALPRPRAASSRWRVGGGGDRDADHATAATFRYFVGFHSRAISRAWAI